MTKLHFLGILKRCSCGSKAMSWAGLTSLTLSQTLRHFVFR